MLRLNELVAYEADPEIDRYYPQQWRAWARIVLSNGRVVQTTVTDPKGDPTNALTDVEMWTKFDQLTSDCWEPERRHRIANVIGGLGASDDFGDLVTAMTLTSKGTDGYSSASKLRLRPRAS